MKVIRGGVSNQSLPSIGLVLGAGGVVGQAYQAGVLAALEREIGWDPRLAKVIVGTSAGSVTGAALRVGVPATDLAASLYGVPTSRRGGAILRRILPTDTGPLPTPTVLSMLRPWNLPSPALLARMPPAPARLPSRGGGHDARPRRPARYLRPRPRPRRPHRRPLARGACASARCGVPTAPASSSGGPVRRPTRLAPAVLASCAIPGYFKPGHHRRRPSTSTAGCTR